MTPTERQRRKRRLERAGFAAVPDGWLPAEDVERIAREIDAHRDDVDRIASEVPPRGRPPAKGREG